MILTQVCVNMMMNFKFYKMNYWPRWLGLIVENEFLIIIQLIPFNLCTCILPNFKYWLSNLHFVWYSPISIFFCRFRKRWCKKTKIQNQFFAVATWRIRKSISILSLPRCIHEGGYGPKIRPQRIQNFGKNNFI